MEDDYDDGDYDDGDYDWSDWTPCEMYGHAFNEDGWCECGAQQDTTE